MPVPFLFASASGAVPASDLDADFADLEAKIQTSSTVVGTAAGTANAITAAFTPTITALPAGLTFLVRAASANTSTTPTFQADGTTAKTIVKGSNLALNPGDIPGAGFWAQFTYDKTLDKYVLDNPYFGVILLGSVSVTGQATLTSVAIPAGLAAVQCVLRDVFPVTAGSNITMRISQGGSIKSDANYTLVGQENAGSAVGTFVGAGGAGNTAWQIAANVIGTANGVAGEITIVQPTSGVPKMVGRIAYLDNASVVRNRGLAGYYLAANGEVDQVQFFANAGNITGTLSLYGVRPA